MATPEKSSEDTNPEEDRADLKDMADNSQEVLIMAESIFPFNFFPDTITVSRMKVSVAKRYFFRVAEVTSMQIDDILNVEVDVGPLFGSLSIYTRIQGIAPLRITFLSRGKAIEVKRVLEGYIIAKSQEIDCSAIPRDELVKRLRRLGGEKTMNS